MSERRHLPKAMTDLSVKTLQDPSVLNLGKVLAPFKPVTKRTDSYYVYDQAQQFRRIDMQRSKGAPAARIPLTELSDTAYVLKRHALAIEVPNEDMKDADAGVDPDTDAVQELTSQVLRNREIEVIERLLTSTAIGTNLVTLSSNAWDLPTTTSSPIDNADTAIQGIIRRTGQIANGLAMGQETFDVLKDHSEVLDRIKWSERGLITQDLLASVLNIDKAYVSKAIQRTTDEGISATTQFILRTQACFFFNNPTPKLKSANFGVTFVGLYGGEAPELTSREDLDKDVTIYEMNWMYDTKVVLSLSAFLFNAVNS